MSDERTLDEIAQDNTAPELVVDERESLKNQLTILGISYANNATTATLRKLLIEGTREDSLKEHVPENLGGDKEDVLKATRLIMATVICNDPSKKELQGELFTVGNDIIGTIRKTIPFGVQWAIPEIILNTLEEKTFQNFITVKHPDGSQGRKAVTLKSYNIIRHATPTQEELDALAKAQAMRGGVGD